MAEILAQLVASNVGILDRPEDGQYEFLSRLRDHGILPYAIHQFFSEVRRTGNSAMGIHWSASKTNAPACQRRAWSNASRSRSSSSRVSGLMRAIHKRTLSSSTMVGMVALVTRWVSRKRWASGAVARWKSPA